MNASAGVAAAAGGGAVTDLEIARGVESVLRQSQSDPNSVTTLNGVVRQVEAKLGLDLSHKAAFIRDQIGFLLRSPPSGSNNDVYAPHLPNPQMLHHQPLGHPPQHQHQHPYPQHPPLQQFYQPHYQSQPQPQHLGSPHFALHTPQDLNFSPSLPPQQHQQPPPLKPAKATAKSRNSDGNVPAGSPKESTAGTKRRGGPGGLNKVCGVSVELQAIVGEPAMPRTEIVKQLWVYIRKNNLQDPSNKRKIICDDALRAVFETDSTDMFKMNKLLSKHILPLEPSKESGQAKKRKATPESAGDNAERGSSPVLISDALAKFLETAEREMLRAEAHKRVWEYVKVHQLEDAINPMGINCDERLRELLGCKSISAFGLPEMLERHHFIKRS
ncbi:hypothetical protein MLD38_019438 [Melastoma candidum]|uniref:Uncharacterized protein n=1 Tax=Melastoma candidum TaxID=119954 RepID=A0ACB9QWG0_9MYRT|nr:hypothetical protein MLD38_019438 [Melastoma candidum]